MRPEVKAIHVVVDAKLLHAADKAARRRKLNRSALVRAALREHLRRLEILELEERDRGGYQARPQTADELAGWESEAVWPAD